MKSAKWWMGLCVAGCLCVAVGASAALPRESEPWGGWMWTYSIGDHGAIVLGASLGGSPATGDLTVPDSLGGQPVVGIGNFSCGGPMSVTIPDSVTSIGDNAFDYCSGLTSVTIPNSVTNIGSRAFECCSGLTSVTIPDSVTSIKNRTFSGCCSLASVTIGDSVTSIGGSAFCDCSGLTSVTIGDSVTSIGGGAFENCSGLTNVAIPDSVTSIGDGAFYNCSGLTSVTIPDSVTSIGDNAFYNCSGLTSVTIGDSVKSFGDNAFSGCSSLKSFQVAMGNPIYKVADGVLFSKDEKILVCFPGGKTGDYAIPDSVTSISSYAFSGCRGLTSVTIPDSVTSIGGAAFFGCSGLTSVTIPDSVTSIESSAFYNCSGLTSVTIPDSVTRIGRYAFSGCRGLTSVTIPDSVTSIGRDAFESCSGLTTLYAPESWKTKYEYDFWSEGGVFWSSHANVPEDCSIIYYAPTKTRTGVPYAWLDEHGLGDGTAEGYEAAATTDAANGAYKVWECYVAGLDPADPAARFTAAIGFTNGTPVVTWTPDLNEKGGKAARAYKVEGRTAMTDEWGATNAASRFFRVRVGLP